MYIIRQIIDRKDCFGAVKTVFELLSLVNIAATLHRKDDFTMGLI